MISYVKVVLSFITKGNAEKCLIYKNSIEKYNATHKLYCDKCESYEWNHTISFKNGDKYLLCDGCVRFFIFLKNKEMASIKDIEKVR